MTDIIDTKPSRLSALIEKTKPSNLSDEKKAKVRKVTKNIVIITGTVAATLAVVVATAKVLTIETAESESSADEIETGTTENE